jgi:hypothetical protein
MDEFYPRVERFEDNFGHVKTPHGIAEGIYNTWVQAGDEVLFGVSVWNPQPEPAMLRAFVSKPGLLSAAPWQTDELLRVKLQEIDIQQYVSIAVEMRSAWAHKHSPHNLTADQSWIFTYKGKPTFS